MTAATPAERDRRILEERARQLARPIGDAAAGLATVELVVFSVAGARYGLETPYVREVARLKDLTPVPGVGDFLIGLTSIRGEFLALIDLRHYLGLPAQGLPDMSYIVVFGSEQADFGILADAVHEMAALPAAAIMAPPAAAAGEAGSYLRGVTRDGLAILDGDRLAADERLFARQG